MPFPLSAVVFDLDGTLHDHHSSVVNALHRWLTALGTPCDDELINAWFTAEDTYFPMWRDGHISYQEQRRRRLRDFLPQINVPVGTDDDLDSLYPEYLSHYEASWSMFDDVESALRTVEESGLRTAILTNGTVGQQNAKVKAFGLSHRFEFVAATEEIGVSKPNPLAFLAVCDRLDLPPAGVIYVGDDYAVDIIGARNAGLRAIHLDRNGIGPYEEIEQIKSLTELGSFLK